MERFVRFVVAGGLALLAGLWAVRLAAPGSLAWAAGVAVAVLGGGALASGIRLELAV